MDRNRPGTGNQDCGTDEMQGRRNLEKVAAERLTWIRQRVMGGLFLFSIGVSIISGIASSAVPIWFSIVISLFGGLGTMFFGMGIQWLRVRQDTEDLQGMVTLNEMRRDAHYRKQLRREIENAKKECGGFAIETSRAVANRVANRLIARHASNLVSEEQREATLQEADHIVDEEIQAFQDALKDESEGV